MESFPDSMDVLRAARSLVGLRQDELAELAGVSRQMIARIEKGDPSVSVGTLQKVRQALERAGVAFYPETAEAGTSIARKKSLPARS